MTTPQPFTRFESRRRLRAAASAVMVEQLEPRRLLTAGLVTTPQTYSGTLDGKIVFTSGGHGWRWSSALNRYATDRGDNNEIVEDFGNQEQLTFYADYLLRAGATVVPMRPIGRQLNEVVLDNDSAGVTYSGLWAESTDPAFAPRYYDEDYGSVADTVRYRNASTTTGAESAVATYTPNIPAAGFYPVYTWVARSTNRTTQLYRVNHSGGSAEIRVDHSKVGLGWVYLGTYHFNSGSSATEGSVQISNNGPAGKVVIADAIRFGNGMGDWIDTAAGAPGVSGYPREDENSFHWIARSVGIGTSLSTATGASSDNNVSAPSNFAQWMYSGAFGEAVYVGFHSNAGGGRGARGLIDSSAPTPHQAGTNGLADILGDQINQDMQNLNGVFEYNWTTGTTSTYTSAFGEINLGAAAEMDATIIEVAFHDDVMDAAIMRDPKGRDQIARSVYQGTVQYFSLYGSPLATNTSLPTPPTNLRVVSNASGAVTLNWSAGATSPAGVYGAAATGYRVYASADGYGFDGGRTVSGVGTTTLTITGLDAGTPYYFRVASTNAGGESGASEVVTALPSGGAKQVLIVSGFDRFDRTQNFRYGYLGGLVDRVWPRYNNSFDYLAPVHTAIAAAKPGTHVASSSNEAVISGAVNLGDYDTVIWVLGNESTVNDTFNATEQTKVEQFIAGGGNLFVSGAEIAWDLDQQNNGRSFYETTLKGNFVSDGAGTHTATADAGGIFAGLSSVVFSSGTAFSSLDTQMYDVATPDVIAPQSGAITALNYGGGSAGIQLRGTGGRGSIVLFGFPFETMTNATRRQQVMGRVLDFFTPSPTPGAPDLLAASDTGSSNSDNLTNRNNASAGSTLQFQVSGTVAGATVTLYNGLVAIGSAVASGTTTTVTTNGSTALTDGLKTITARQTESGKAESLDSPSLGVTIDTVAPTATLGSQAPARGDANLDFTVTYADANGVNAATFDGNDVTVTGPNGYNSPASFVSAVGNVVTYRIPAPGGAWDASDNGTYTVTQAAGQIADVAGNTRGAGAIGAGLNVNVAFAYLVGNVLHADYTAPGHSIALVRNGTNVDATQGAATLSFALGSFTSIVVSGTGGQDTLDFTGPIAQPLTFNGGIGGDAIHVHAGTFTFASDAAGTTLNLDVTVDSGAAASFDATQHLDDLVVNGDATLTTGGAKVLVTRSLTIGAAGALDLNDNDLVVNYSSVSPVGTWTGSAYDGVSGLIASARLRTSAGSGSYTTLGVAEASQVLNLSGAQTGLFSDETVDATSVLVKFTYGGDANLDGKLNVDDYGRMDFNAPLAVSGWFNGDYNFDGKINVDDYGIIDFNIGIQGAPL